MLCNTLCAYEVDIQNLVHEGVKANIKTPSPDDNDNAITERETSLQKWMTLKFPYLGYANLAHALLVQAICYSEDAISYSLLLSSHSPKFIDWFVSQLLHAVDNDTQWTFTLFVTQGHAILVFHDVISQV